MAKFQFQLFERVARRQHYEITVTKAEIVEAFDLEGDDKADWRDYVEDYLMDFIGPVDAVERGKPVGDPEYDDADADAEEIEQVEELELT